MGKASLTDRLRHWLIEPHYPNVGIEVNSDSIRLAVVSTEKGRVQIQHFDSEELPPGTVDINPFKPNIQNLEVAAEALKSLWSRNRFRSSKICLLLQDRVALTFQVALEHPAANRQECLDLIRFKLKKSVPFRIEEAQVSYFDTSGISAHHATMLWAIVMNQAVLQQYEKCVQSAVEAECGLVDLATFNLLNFAHSEIKGRGFQEEDFLYVNLNRNYISTAITQKGKLTFYRSRPLEGQNGTLDEALAEIHPATMFYLDKLSGDHLARAFVYSVESPEELSSRIESGLKLKSSVLSLDPIAPVQFDPSSQRYLRTFTPLLGLILSRKVEFL